MNNSYQLKSNNEENNILSFIDELIESKNIRKYHMKDKSLIILDRSTWEFQRNIKENDEWSK